MKESIQINSTQETLDAAKAQPPAKAVALIERHVGLMRPAVSLQDVQVAKKELDALVKSNLKDGVDYGSIAGMKKPFLWKPGAEQVAAWYGCAIEPEVIDKTINLEKKAYRYVVRCAVIHRSTGDTVGAGVGASSSSEKAYGGRNEGNENTILKMAKKRAMVDAVLSTFALSGQFTQDEDSVTTNGKPKSKENVFEQRKRKMFWTLAEYYKKYPILLDSGEPEESAKSAGRFIHDTTGVAYKKIETIEQVEKVEKEFHALTAEL